MRPHPRAEHLRLATRGIEMALSVWPDRMHLNLYEELGAFLAVQHNLACRIIGFKADPKPVAGALDELFTSAQRGHDLTDLELLDVVTTQIARLVDFLVREERRSYDPDEPDNDPDNDDDQDPDEDDEP